MSIEFLILAGALYVGFTIGGNDAANCMGACVGGGVLGLRRAVIIAAIFALLGGLIGGSGVTETVAKDIIPSGEFTPEAAAVCLLAAGFIVAFATLRGIPVSTSHAIILGLVGAGVAINVSLNIDNLILLASAWILVPFAMIPLSLAVVSILNSLLSRVSELAKFEVILKYLLVFSAIYASFALGANHAGLAGGMLEGIDLLGRFGAILVGSLSISLGMIILSSRVITTVGMGITSLDPASAFSMQISAALGLTICSIIGIPISSSQTIVAAAVGVGLSRGGSEIDREQVKKIGVYWLVVPIATMAVAYIIMRLIGT
jgi:PiT family inorganic phosphate transporter